MSMAFLRGHGVTGNLGLPGASRAHRMRSESPPPPPPEGSETRMYENVNTFRSGKRKRRQVHGAEDRQGPGAAGCGADRTGPGGGGVGCGEDGEGLRAGESECFLPEENVLRGQKYNYIFKKCERQPGN